MKEDRRSIRPQDYGYSQPGEKGIRSGKSVRAVTKSGDRAMVGRCAYPEYKDSGIEWLGEIPDGWNALRLKNIATYNDDTLGETTDPDFEILYTDISSVDKIVGIKKKEMMTFENAPSRARRKVIDGDVIISTVRTYLRAIAPISNSESNLIVSTGFAVIRPTERFDSRFASYALRAPYFVEEVVANSVGVSYPAINASILVTFSIALPTKEEQRAIAVFLDRETARIDALVEKKERQIELLKEKRSALISHAVTKGLNPDAPMKASGIEWLGEIPGNWDVIRLGYMTECLDGKRIPLNAEERSYRQGPYPYWGANGILDHLDDWLFDGELILLGEDGAPFFDRNKDVAFQVTGRIWVNNHIHVLRVRRYVRPRWLMYSLNITSYADHIKGSTRDKLTQSEMNDIPVPVPPQEEQRAIAVFLDRETKRIDTLIEKVEESIDRLREYRTALISAAVTGKIDARGEVA